MGQRAQGPGRPDERRLTAGPPKLWGGYYTPAPLAEHLSRWAVAGRGPVAVLEPSAGDGAFVRATHRHLNAGGRIDAVELFADEAEGIRAHGLPGVRVFTGDALGWYSPGLDASYDAVVGNPPFIRYQTFPEPHRQRGFALMRHVGLHPNRLTNAWVPFVVLATRALKAGGRLAMVVPAELLQVSYAAELRDYLARTYSSLTVLTFRRLLFPGIQQEAVLLMGVRGNGGTAGTAGGISLRELDGLEDLTRLGAEQPPAGQRPTGHDKWTAYYLSSRELGLLRAVEACGGFTTLGQLAEVDVGIVTGRNQFFVLTPHQAAALGVRRHCLPLVARSAQVPGLVLSDAPCLLLQLGATDREELDPAARAYVETGEAAGYHHGYKCRIRLPNWWNVPSAWVPDAFLLRQIHDGPKVVLNRAGATCTDTIHRVRAQPGVDPAWLASAATNSATFAFSEIRGRSYGGGVLELEPTEAEALPMPKPGRGVGLSLEELDQWARTKGIDALLDEVDRVVLQGCGLSKAEVQVLRGAWRRLAQRRMNRRRRS